MGDGPTRWPSARGGVLYGTTRYGGTNGCALVRGCGTVFSLTPPGTSDGDWTETVLYNFAGYPNDGSDPAANVVVGNGGVLYGTSLLGGSNNSGAVFSLAPTSAPDGDWTETVLYDFSSETFGCSPSQLISGDRGVLYGLSAACGSSDESTVFSLTPPATPGGKWKQTVLHSFAGGAGPNSLIRSGGVRYGTTFYGGTTNNGTLFSLTPPGTEGGSWTETVLYFFTGGSDGGIPTGVAMGSGGVLYGTTESGGISNFGTVFSFAP